MTTEPMNMSEYAWVAPAEAWAMHDALDTRTGDTCVMLGAGSVGSGLG